MENWKPVVGFAGFYEVSDLGRVRRIRTCSGDRCERLLKPGVNSDGYALVNLYVSGKRYNRHNHRLVAEAFIPNPLGLPEVNHKNGKEKLNNCVDNLEWISHKGNVEHAWATGLCADERPCGERHSKSKLTWSNIEEIRNRYSSGDVTQQVLASEYAVSLTAIQAAISGRTWKKPPLNVTAEQAVA